MTTQSQAAPPERRADTRSDGAEKWNVSILVVDDEPGMRNYLLRMLDPRCSRIVAADSAEEASRRLDEQHFDLILLDNVMPGASGLTWLQEQRKVGLFADVILLTAYADLDTVIHALRAGASDFLLKPFRANQIINAISRCLERRSLRRENFLLKYELTGEHLAARGRLLGKSRGIETVRDTLEKVAPLNTPVLFTGESGTGKEIAARTLHAMSERRDHPFVAINCAALSPERLHADLFGGKDGAGHETTGLLVQASNATLFLDEVAELPGALQGALLRVIDEGVIRPEGSHREVPLNLRFAFATNADLPKAVEEGRFRRDLYHRINVLEVAMPPLRDRVGDIPELASLFMDKVSRELGVEPLPLGDSLLLNLARYDWPGNVRELRNLIERALILREFPPEFADDGSDGPDEAVESLQAVERRHILTVLEACGGNRAEAARRLGVSRKTIDRKCAMWNV